MADDNISEKTSEPTYLRDHLASDRTKLSNERTLLSYIRTSLTMFVAGITFIKYFNNITIKIIGWVFLPTAMLIMFIGRRSFKNMKKRLDSGAEGQEHK